LAKNCPVFGVHYTSSSFERKDKQENKDHRQAEPSNIITIPGKALRLFREIIGFLSHKPSKYHHTPLQSRGHEASRQDNMQGRQIMHEKWKRHQPFRALTIPALPIQKHE
jgi:hypothetical protein